MGINSREEGIEVKWVVVEHDSPNIANDFTDETDRHPSKEGPSLVSQSEANLSNENEAKDCSVGNVAAHGRDVWYLALLR